MNTLPIRYKNLAQSVEGDFKILLEKPKLWRRLKIVDDTPYYFVEKDTSTGKRRAIPIPFGIDY